MIKTIVICDVCAREVELPRRIFTDSQLTRELDLLGWSQRTDALSEVCPTHTMPPVLKRT
jgi:hypothetical protein